MLQLQQQRISISIFGSLDISYAFVLMVINPSIEFYFNLYSINFIDISVFQCYYYVRCISDSNPLSYHKERIGKFSTFGLLYIGSQKGSGCCFEKLKGIFHLGDSKMKSKKDAQVDKNL